MPTHYPQIQPSLPTSQPSPPSPSQPPQPSKFDIRQYIGLFVFYWRFITLCVLLCLAGAALYIQYFPKVYEASCSLMVTRDPYLELGATRAHTPLQQFGAHAFLLDSEAVKQRAAMRLADEWGPYTRYFRGGHLPEVTARRRRGLHDTLDISVRGGHPEYLEAFLKVLLEEHESEWYDRHAESSEGAIEVLETELAAMQDQITRAEEELIEFQRLHDIARIEAIGAHESRQLSSLISRRGQLSTEIMMLESQYPFLQDADLGVIDSVDMMTRETAWLAMIGSGDDNSEDFERSGMGLHPMIFGAPRDEASAAVMRGWQELRVELERLREREKELAENFTADHPRRIEIANQIKETQEQLDKETRVRMQRLLDRREALQIQLSALRDAEEDWQARNLLASRRRSELDRLSNVLRRYESNYNTLYARLHDLRVSRELNAETFNVVRPVKTDDKPVWPDPLRIFMLALVIGLGGGLGLTLAFDYFGNRIQFPRDVEQDLHQPFLGGIPYWAHSGLDNMVRPTIIENENQSAIEAYRTLRSMILDELAKINENTVLFSSADSREGKTLTVLNTSILTARLGRRVLLLDMDLRRGRLHRSLDLNRSPGVTEALQNGRPLRDFVAPTRFENLDFIPSGKPINHAAEIFHGDTLNRLLEPLKQEYDYIFVDTPPILRASESMMMCNQRAGGVVFLARVNRTSKPLIRYALKMIKEAHILGIVVNSIELHRISSLYYVYQYPNASYNYYEYGRYGEPSSENRFARTLGRARHRTIRWIRRKLLS